MPYRINVLLEIASAGWNLIRKEVIKKFSNCKDLEVRYLLDLLDNTIPLVLEVDIGLPMWKQCFVLGFFSLGTVERITTNYH